MTSTLEAHELYRFFRAGEEEILALRGVSLTVGAGEIVCVVGPSGSGKSTLLACLAGVDEPDGGTVHIAGDRLSHRPERERAKIRATRIGILMQTRNLLPHLDVAANVRLAQSTAGTRPTPRPLRSPRSLTPPAPAALLEEVGLGHRATAIPRELSGGELVRAGLAVALANDPALLLADEPTGELDGESERQVLSLLKHRASRGTGVLVVTHSAEVMHIADRVVALHDGKVEA